MAQPRTRDGSTTSMPDIGIPVHCNRNDTGVGSQSRSSDSRSQISLTPQERLRAIEVARVERDTLVVILEQQCREIEQQISNHGRRSILNHLNTQIHSRLDQVRDAHFLYNQRLWEAKKPMTDAYNYIIGIEIRVRGVSQQVDHYLDDRRNSPASTASRAATSVALLATELATSRLRRFTSGSAPVLKNPGYPRIVAKNSCPWAIRVAYLPKWLGVMGKPDIPTAILENGSLQSAKLN
ncbi:hypothetical protein OUZ56_011517 [Daphnia magna]|uniref:Uncharacterized protein n=1 Tax=Daphnia magna TaxID=35525 RepID=A0ABQ9Z0Q3_9CRUS|nr:hypothetical protein OUZ56_011517 [Daphnia magna]